MDDQPNQHYRPGPGAAPRDGEPFWPPDAIVADPQQTGSADGHKPPTGPDDAVPGPGSAATLGVGSDVAWGGVSFPSPAPPAAPSPAPVTPAPPSAPADADPWAPSDIPTRGTASGPASPPVHLDAPFTLGLLDDGTDGGTGTTAPTGPVPREVRATPPESPWAQPPQRPAAEHPATTSHPAGPPHPTNPPQPFPQQQGHPHHQEQPRSQGQPHPGYPHHQGQPVGPTPGTYGPSTQTPGGAGYPPAAGYAPGAGHPPAVDVPGYPPAPRMTPHPPVGPHQPRTEVHPGVAQVPQQPYGEAPGVTWMPPPGTAYPEPAWTPDDSTPTAEEFARRRATRPADPIATMGVRAAVNRSTLGLVRLSPSRHEQEIRQDVEMVRRNFGGLRQVTVVNPKGGAGKTVAILLLAMTFGQKRGGYVLAWDNNETQGTLGMRAQQDFHSRTVRDMLRDLGQFQVSHGRVGDLSQYVRSQGEGMFDVLASDESATGGEMLTATAFAEIREVVSRFYKLIFVDTGNNVRAQNWQAAIDATDQLLITMSARNDSAETAARMLDHLEQSGRQRLVRQAVTVVSMPPSRKEIDLPAIQRHFAARTRAVLLAPYERLIDTGEPIRYGQLSGASRDAWLKIAAAVAEGL
ncbi:chromosome partitioning protein [Micromonospora sp. NPDC050417]|uniref:chromosome partitioning protein n=1 Tax=Micromonospora sp. NPDC050417 TaxID=3364280 RepID=UPI003788BA7C